MKAVNVRKLPVGTVITIIGNTRTGDRSYQGDLLGIVAIDAPFVVVKHLTRDYMYNSSLKIKDWIFAVPSDDYIDAMKVGHKQEETLEEDYA